MLNNPMDPVAFLRSKGDLDSLQGQRQGQSSSRVGTANTHVHLPPNFSAFSSVQQAVSMAKQQGVLVLGVGNYYDYQIYKTFCSLALDAGVFPLFGTEIIAMQPDLRDRQIRVNDPVNPGKTYVCGKGITRFNDLTVKASQILGLIRQNDSSRIAQVIGGLRSFFDAHGLKTGLDPQEIIRMMADRYGCPEQTIVLQERHVALAFQQRSFELLGPGKRSKVLSSILVDGAGEGLEQPLYVQQQIRDRFMKAGRPCFVPETYIELEQARQLIWELGGIDCYPVVADMVQGGCEFEVPVDQLAQRLDQMGFRMVEFISVRNSAQALAEYVLGLRRAGFAVSNGTEHNTTEMIPLVPTCKAGTPLPDDVAGVFWEGACVIAGHQFLVANGQEGLVNGPTRDRISRKEAEDRIRYLAKVGQEVINRFTANYGGSSR